MADHPKVENAPGLTWRRKGDGWEARWRPRTDLVARGYPSSPQRLWAGTGEPTEQDRAWISDRCNIMQAEMLVWGRGGLPQMGTYDGTLGSLIRCYQTDPVSTYHKLRYTPRLHATRLCGIITADHGDVRVAEIKARQVRLWHEEWSKRGISMAHGLIGRLRTVIGFGADFLDNEDDCDDCERVASILHRQRFKMGKPRTEALTAEQAIAIRRMAHALGRHSIALAQAFQFELMLRQKDVIGEWIPLTEPGPSDVIHGNYKWMRGLRWQEIDANLILRHTTSKREKEIVVDLKLAPMVMEELRDLGDLPSSGPVIISETTIKPYEAPQFRTTWRKIARAAGVPDKVFNMDSRAGGITEALLAGAPLDAVRKSATHSDSSMTQKYSRSDEEAGKDVQIKRLELRNKK